jgi:hypothetical protein
MAGTLTISTLSDGTNSTSSTNCIQGSAKAWVNFNGVTTTSIRAAYNVSSVTRNGTGNYTINFTTAMVDANYAITGLASRDVLSNPAPANGIYTPAPTTTSCTVQAGNTSNALNDALYYCVAIFR